MNYTKGLRDGIPVGLGYLAVSFGFGITAVRAGLSVLQAAVISATNLTSAGQAAGVTVIAENGTLIEMALVQIVINIRYSLMALSLSQRLDSSFNTGHRLIAAYGITDEIFALASMHPGRVAPGYMYGLITDGFMGWVAGTVLGAVAGDVLPPMVSNALGIMIYGMFVALIIPPSKKAKNVLFTVATAAALSIGLKLLFPSLSAGFGVIIAGAVSAGAAALLFPVADDKEEKA